MNWLGRLFRKVLRFAILSAIATAIIIALDAALSPDEPADRP